MLHSLLSSLLSFLYYSVEDFDSRVPPLLDSFQRCYTAIKEKEVKGNSLAFKVGHRIYYMLKGKKASCKKNWRIIHFTVHF